MRFSDGVLVSSAAINLSEQAKVLDYIKRHPSKEGALAKKAYICSIIIIFSIIFLVMIPLFIYAFSQISNTYENAVYPYGATKEVRGHISQYDKTFWYTDSSKKYEFDLDKYTDDNTFESGEIITVYLDDNSNVVGISHQNQHNDLAFDISLVLIVPIMLLLLHAFISRKTYCKWWYLYLLWYQKEVEPYSFRRDFEENTSDKQFYNVMVDLKQLSVEEQKKYKKALFKNILYIILFFIGLFFIVYLCFIFDLNLSQWFVCAGVIIYTIIFYLLTNNCDVEMRRIKSGYYKDNIRK